MKKKTASRILQPLFRATRTALCLITALAASIGSAQEFKLPDLPESVYLFTSFRGSGDGLHMAWSTDAESWKELESVYINPTVGDKLMRDPHILRADDGVYHLVWTTGWHDKGIGYANSRDLIHWSEQKYIPLFEEVEGTDNCWAPETFYDAERKEFMITWSSSIKGRFTETESADRMNNRTYYVTTRDFRAFSEPKVLIDPGFDHIDATILRDNNQYIAVIKEGDKQQKGEHGPIYYLTADDPHGPWELQKPAIITERAEGPALVKVGDEVMLYVDFYSNGRYGAYKTSDWKTWNDVSSEVKTVKGQRHGTVLKIPGDHLKDLLLRDKAWTGVAPAPVMETYTADPSIRVFGDTYYIYPTTDQPNWKTTEFNVWSSKNLVDWKRENTIIDLSKTISWANIRAWAPDCIERDGKYYFYFCGDGKIGVAVGSSPTGPFKDALDKPLLDRKADDRIHTNTIDPWAFIDDGQAYLYWGNGMPCQVIKLNDDMISTDGDPVDINLRDFREGIVVFKRNGKYYFMWSIDDARSPNYRVGWGTSDSPYGPVTSPNERDDFIVLEKNPPAIGTAHHSVVNVPGTDRWYVAYHRHGLPGGGGYKRQTCLVRMEFDDEGNILPMDPLTTPFKPGDIGEPIIDGKGLESIESKEVRL
ncbi:MAG: family 43 glycosylhydrolase [Pontiellaceae bacterium]|nr:family 43 glycosylhydrolase [Pontiellaceae bacterium]